MKVRRTNGTLSNKSGTAAWLAYWEKLSGHSAYLCFGQSCINTPSVGAVVQRDSLTDKSFYVIPLCRDCNKKKGEELDIWDTRTLVSADAVTASGFAAVTAGDFAQWASERFPVKRELSQASLRIS
jgi:hypothetical protein